MKRYLSLLLFSLCLVCLATTACSDSFADAVAAYDRQDYATALRLLRPLAEQGHAAAQYNLGLMYHEGKGVAQDYAQAVAWFRKAAEQGIAQAQFYLGFMYEKGLGVAQDKAQAVAWFRKAAEQGIAQAVQARKRRVVPQNAGAISRP